VTVVRIQLQAEGWKVRAAGNEGTRTTAGADIFDITTSHAVDESKLQQCQEHHAHYLRCRLNNNR